MLHLVGGGTQTKAKELRVEEDLAEALGEGPVEEQEPEGLEGENQLEECPAEALGEDLVEEQETEEDGTREDLSGALTKVLTREGLGEAQWYDKTLGKIREKAGKEERPYFWKEGILMREPYQALGKSLIIVPSVARERVLRMAHHSPISGHFGKERTLHMIRARVDWLGIVKDMNEMCASCPVCQKAGPAIMARAPL